MWLIASALLCHAPQILTQDKSGRIFVYSQARKYPSFYIFELYHYLLFVLLPENSQTIERLRVLNEGVDTSE